MGHDRNHRLEHLKRFTRRHCIIWACGAWIIIAAVVLMNFEAALSPFLLSATWYALFAGFFANGFFVVTLLVSKMIDVPSSTLPNAYQRLETWLSKEV